MRKMISGHLILESKMNSKQKDLVLLPHPFSDQEGKKVRPAIVVSNESFNKRCQDYVMVPLTTVVRDGPYSILIGQEDLVQGNLLKKSRVRVDKIFTIRKNLVITKIGAINDKTFGKIRLEISRIF